MNLFGFSKILTALIVIYLLSPVLGCILIIEIICFVLWSIIKYSYYDFKELVILLRDIDIDDIDDTDDEIDSDYD